MPLALKDVVYDSGRSSRDSLNVEKSDVESVQRAPAPTMHSIHKRMKHSGEACTRRPTCFAIAIGRGMPFAMLKERAPVDHEEVAIPTTVYIQTPGHTDTRTHGHTHTQTHGHTDTHTHTDTRTADKQKVNMQLISRQIASVRSLILARCALVASSGCQAMTQKYLSVLVYTCTYIYIYIHKCMHIDILYVYSRMARAPLCA